MFDWKDVSNRKEWAVKSRTCANRRFDWKLSKARGTCAEKDFFVSARSYLNRRDRALFCGAVERPEGVFFLFVFARSSREEQKTLNGSQSERDGFVCAKNVLLWGFSHSTEKYFCRSHSPSAHSWSAALLCVPTLKVIFFRPIFLLPPPTVCVFIYFAGTLAAAEMFKVFPAPAQPIKCAEGKNRLRQPITFRLRFISRTQKKTIIKESFTWKNKSAKGGGGRERS